MALTTYKGGTFSTQFAEALREVDRLLPHIPVVITQGGYRTSVKASAGTHAGDAVDISVRNLTKDQVASIIMTLRKVGIAAWFRTTKYAKWGTRAHGFGSYHIHGVPNGWGSPSSGARRQAESYRRGRDGLASDQADLGPGHTSEYRTTTWTSYLNGRGPSHSTPSLPSGGLSMTDINKILEELATIKENTATAFGPLGGRQYISEHNKTTGNYILSYPIHRGGGTIKLIQELADTRSATIRLEAQLAGLTKALEAMASGQGVDLKAVSKAAADAASNAVSEVKTDLMDEIRAVLSNQVGLGLDAEAIVDELAERLAA